jgi:hypothetical protein
MEIFLSAMLAMTLSFFMTIIRHKLHSSDENKQRVGHHVNHFDDEDVFVETFMITVVTICIVRMINLRDFFSSVSKN